MKFSLFIFIILFSSFSQSAMMIEGSRIIIKHTEKEVTLPIKNTSKYPVIIQSWVDDGDPNGTPEKAVNSPVIVIPTLFRLNESELKYIRLVNKYISHPDDRESLYWLNLYEVTPVSKNEQDKASVVNVAVRLQVKLFYRPDHLKANISEISRQLQFILGKSGRQLTIKNPTPFYVTFNHLQLEKESEPFSSLFLAPFSEQQIEIKQNNYTGDKVQYSLIDDEGEQNDYEKSIDLR